MTDPMFSTVCRLIKINLFNNYSRLDDCAQITRNLLRIRIQRAAAGSFSQVGQIGRADATACSGFVLRGRAGSVPEIFGLGG